MRAILALALVVGATSVAHADEHCAVTYVTVPDGIRQVIETWVAAEPHCTGTIALRVIPTKDGLFLFAERPDGTVHERLVPDLTAAGVLVASWVSDSWHVQPPPRKRTKKPKRQMELRVMADDQRVEAVVPAPSSPGPKRWISLGGVLVGNAEGADLGFRLELDVLMWGKWKLGAIAQKAEDTMHVYANGDYYQGQIDDWSAGAYLARTMRWGGWELRAGAGILLMRSRLHEADFPSSGYDIAPSPVFELSAAISRDIGQRWAASFTLANGFISQEWTDSQMTVTRDESQTLWIANLKRRI